jgi:hypothetical protein
MSRSETAFEKVARRLAEIREKLGRRDSLAIDNAVDLLLGVGDLFYRGSAEDGEDCDADSFHLHLIREGGLDIVAVSRRPLSEREKVELTRRCTSPLSWPLCSGVSVDSTGHPTQPATPVYDREGHFIGTILDLPPGRRSGGPAEGGAA